MGWCHDNYDGGSICHKPNRTESPGFRYIHFRDWLDAAFVTRPFNRVYYEDVRGHKGTFAAHIYGGLQATLQTWCDDAGVEYSGVPVGTIKKAVTGKGNASKQMVIDAMKELGYTPQDDNQADALALREYIRSIKS